MPLRVQMVYRFYLFDESKSQFNFCILFAIALNIKRKLAVTHHG